MADSGPTMTERVYALVLRFPAPVLWSTVGTILLLGAGSPFWWGMLGAPDVPETLAYACTPAFVASFAVTLAGETRGWPRTWSITAGLAPFILVAALARAVDLNLALMLFGLLLTLGLAPCVTRDCSQDRYWAFNHELWTAALVALVGAVTFALGVSAILATIKFLFGLGTSWQYDKLWLVSFGFLGPMGWLAHTPRADAATLAGPQRDSFVSRAVSSLVGYVLAPLVMVYAAVLHVYAAKIGLEGALPDGRLGAMVMSYGACLTLTAVLAYPDRDDGSLAVRVLWRIWPWLLAVPTIMLALAIATRIRAYGLTEERYVVALAGLWFFSHIVTQGVLADRRDIRLVSAGMAALLLVGAIGPWGAIGLSLRQQTADLMAHLNEAGIIADGKLVTPHSDKPTLSPRSQQRVYDIVEFLAQRGRLDVLQPLFAGAGEDDPFARPRGPAHVIASDVRARLGVEPTVGPRNPDGGGERTFSFYAASPSDTALTDGGRLIGPLSSWNSRGTSPKPQVIGLSGGDLSILHDGARLTISSIAGSKEASFDLSNLAARVADGKRREDTGKRDPVILTRAGGHLDCRIVLTQANGVYAADETSVEVTSINFWILIGDKGPPQ